MAKKVDMYSSGQAGTAEIDPGSFTREPTAEELKKAAERTARDKEALKGQMPGDMPPGTLRIDPQGGLAGPDYQKSQDLFTQAREGYRGTNLGYNPYSTAAGTQLQGMNYNPYKSAAINQSQAQAGSDYQGLLSNLQQTGGVSSSDRLNAAQNFNRQKIMGTLGSGAQFDQRGAQSQFGANLGNMQRGMAVEGSNMGAANDAAQFGAQANQRRLENLYGGAMGEKNLGRQVEAADLISRYQRGGGTGGVGSGALDFLFYGGDRLLGNMGV